MIGLPISRSFNVLVAVKDPNTTQSMHRWWGVSADELIGQITNQKAMLIPSD